ncbi:hypothetical protein BHM03_00046544 [Ensete ventricosum]|nr:hypothetical protein BHM03_00046544 [Ensete ventricosum]
MTRATILSSPASVEVNAWREMYSSLSKADNAARSPAMTSSTLLQPQLHSSSRRPSHSSHFLPCILLYYHRQRLILLSPYLPVAPLSLVPVATSSTKSTCKGHHPSSLGDPPGRRLSFSLGEEVSAISLREPSQLERRLCSLYREHL